MHKYTSDQIDWMRENRPKLIAPEFVAAFNEKFGCNIKKETLRSRSQAYGVVSGNCGKFKKGQPAHNKGKKGLRVSPGSEFKKGNVPHNYVPIGHEITDNREGYTKIKIADPNTWKHKHVIIWEQRHKMAKPKGHAIVFVDGDKQNFSEDNLLLVTRGALCVFNHRGYINRPLLIRKTLWAMVELEVKANKVLKNKLQTPSMEAIA